MMTLEKFEEASELVKKVTNPTKLIYSEYLSAQTGAKVYLKPENMQHTGAYKIRGAYYKISTLTDEERSMAEYVTATSSPIVIFSIISQYTTSMMSFLKHFVQRLGII